MQLIMASIVGSFILLLFLFQTVKPDDSQIIEIIKEILIKGFDTFDGSTFENENATFASKILGPSGEQEVIHEKLKIQTKRLYLSHRLFEHVINSTKCRMNTTKHFAETLSHVENFRYAVIAQMNKDMGPFDESTLKTMEIEDLLLFDVREEMSKEYENTLNQIQTLKIKLYIWYKHFIQSQVEQSTKVASVIDKFSRDELGSENDENEDTDEEDPEMIMLQKIASMTNNEYNEKSANKKKAVVESEINIDNTLSEVTDFPRWIPTLKDIEEINSKYLTWMELFEHSGASQIQSLKETVLKTGQSIKLFCKTLAEYVNTANIIQECKSKNDTECAEVMQTILDQPHFKKFLEIFTSWKTNEDL